MDQSKTKRARARWGAGRVALLAQQDEVHALVSAGWTLKAIYEDRRERLGGVTYEGFRKLVQRHIGRPRRSSQGARKPATERPMHPRAGTVALSASRRPGEPLELTLAPPQAIADKRKVGLGQLHDPTSEGDKELI